MQDSVAGIFRCNSIKKFLIKSLIIKKSKIARKFDQNPLFIHKEMSTAKAPWLWIEIESILPSLKRAFTLNHCSNGAFFFILNIFPLSIYVFPIHKIFYTLVSISMLFIYISLFVLYTIKIYIYICWYLTQHSTHTLDVLFFVMPPSLFALFSMP